MNSEQMFYEDLARTYERWLSIAVESLTEPQADTTQLENRVAFNALATAISAAGLEDDLRRALAEILTGLLHSTLVTLDNGTALAESVQLTLTDQNGTELGPGLHEGFFQHLASTDRL